MITEKIQIDSFSVSERAAGGMNYRQLPPRSINHHDLRGWYAVAARVLHKATELIGRSIE